VDVVTDDVFVDNTTTEIAEQQRCRDLGFCTAESSLIFVVTWYKVAPRFSNVNRNVTVPDSLHS